MPNKLKSKVKRKVNLPDYYAVARRRRLAEPRGIAIQAREIGLTYEDLRRHGGLLSADSYLLGISRHHKDPSIRKAGKLSHKQMRLRAKKFIEKLMKKEK